MIEYKIEHETEVEFFVGTPSVSSSSESLEFLVVVHYVTSIFLVLVGFLEFSSGFFQIYVSPNDVISLAVFNVCPRKLIYIYIFYF